MINISNKTNLLKISSQEKIAVAVSGGSDSMALTLLANDYFDTPITAITVDHCLRNESRNEALQVGKWLGEYDIHHKILSWHGGKPNSNIQAEARNARYELMGQYCNENDIKYIFVAHNKNDQAETLLMRLMRGSGVRGLASIAEISSFNNIKIVRPLLDFSKIEIKSYLNKINQDWIEDPSNSNDKYERVRVRNIINDLDDSDLFIDRLAKTAKNLQRSNSYIEKNIEQDQKDICTFHKLAFATIHRKEFINLHIEAKYRILSNIIKQIGGAYYNIRFEKLDNALRIIEENTNINLTIGRCEIYSSKKKSEQNIIYIIREIANLPIIKINNQDSIVWDNRFTVNTKNYDKDAIIRAMTSDDAKFLQESGKFKIDKTVNKKIYYSLPVIENSDGVVLNDILTSQNLFTIF